MAAKMSAVDTTRANSPCRLVAVARTSSSAGERASIRAGPIERVAGVEREQHVVAEIPGDARGGLATMVGGDATNHDSRDLIALQPGVQVRSAVEGGVHLLGD